MARLFAGHFKSCRTVLGNLLFFGNLFRFQMMIIVGLRFVMCGRRLLPSLENAPLGVMADVPGEPLPSKNPLEN